MYLCTNIQIWLGAPAGGPGLAGWPVWCWPMPGVPPKRRRPSCPSISLPRYVYPYSNPVTLVGAPAFTQKPASSSITHIYIYTHIEYHVYIYIHIYIYTCARAHYLKGNTGY